MILTDSSAYFRQSARWQTCCADEGMPGRIEQWKGRSSRGKCERRISSSPLLYAALSTETIGRLCFPTPQSRVLLTMDQLRV